MLKIFATQLNGVFQKIAQEQNEPMEDAARLLTQAMIAEGKVYIYGKGEMSAVTTEALSGAEPLRHAASFPSNLEIGELTAQDRVLLLTRSSNDNETAIMAKKLYDHQIPFVAVYSPVPDQEDPFQELADVCIHIPLKRGLVPTEDGNRTGLPYSMAALYIYYGIKFTIDEILAEMDEEF